MRLRVGMYSVFLRDWLNVYPRHQMKIVRTEDYAVDPVGVVAKLFKFLKLSKYWYWEKILRFSTMVQTNIKT